MPPSKRAEPSSGDWAARLAGKIEEVVAFIRDRSVRPIFAAVHVVIFGVVILVLAVVLLVLFLILMFRILDNYVFPGQEWASFAVMGGIFVTAGLFLISRRGSPDSR
jgi:hypothetical protein